MTTASERRQFSFQFETSMTRWNRLFGITPRTSVVAIGNAELVAEFGPWTLRTPLNNITAVASTGPFRWWRVVGPARLSLSDRGLTFATNTRRGLCLTFRDPVTAIEPFGLIRHPTLTVTVHDPAGLSEAIGLPISRTHVRAVTAPALDPSGHVER